MTKKQWIVAVIGCGFFANAQYLPNIEKETNAVCVAAVDIVPERAQQACETYHIPHWYSSVYELIEKCDFDIAIDAASIQAHHEINMAVIGAGKHLISQKPAAPTVELMTVQIEAAKAAGVKFACAPIHDMRYDLNFAKQLIADGASAGLTMPSATPPTAAPSTSSTGTRTPPGSLKKGPVRWWTWASTACSRSLT